MGSYVEMFKYPWFNLKLSHYTLKIKINSEVCLEKPFLIKKLNKNNGKMWFELRSLKQKLKYNKSVIHSGSKLTTSTET